jgi:hypothetical protein
MTVQNETYESGLILLASYYLVRPINKSPDWVFHETPLCMRISNYSNISVFCPWMTEPHRTNSLRVYTKEDARKLWDYLIREGFVRKIL